MTLPAPSPEVLAAADAAVRAGDLAKGAALLEAALPGHAAGKAQWLQLAGLRRALRQPRKALDAVHHALALDPLDFMSLVMRAGLLERTGDPQVGEAWAEALSQRPPGDLPPPLAAAVKQGEQLAAAHAAARAVRHAAATAASETGADEDEAWRIARFRSNVLRKTRVWHSQPTHFHYPGLVEREFHPRAHFPWLTEVESSTPIIRAEMLAALNSARAELLPYIQYEEHEALDQWRPLNRNPDWTAIHLWRMGQRVEANAALCPRTMDLLERMPQPQIPGASPNAMFSLLAPHTVIPPHVGVNNTRLLCHLPLVVPEGCWFRVGGETRPWREGQAFVFDDTVEHEAANPTGQLRVVMIFDIWHPDLSQRECDAVSALVAAEQAATPI